MLYIVWPLKCKGVDDKNAVCFISQQIRVNWSTWRIEAQQHAACGCVCCKIRNSNQFWAQDYDGPFKPTSIELEMVGFGATVAEWLSKACFSVRSISALDQSNYAPNIFEYYTILILSLISVLIALRRCRFFYHKHIRKFCCEHFTGAWVFWVAILQVLMIFYVAGVIAS